MFIEHIPKPVPWADRTMSILERNRLQACEKDLAGLPKHGLFDPDVSDIHAEDLFDASWYALEEKPKELHTVNGLKSRVLECFAEEMCLLSPEEHDLMVKAVLLGGHLPLAQPDSLFPAYSLARRLWAKVLWTPRFPFLELPSPVCMSAVLALANDELHRLHERLAEIFDTVDNTLYLAGMLNADTVIGEMTAAFRDTLAAGRIPLFRRALRAGFDTFLDGSGNLFLIHPGLADPGRLLAERRFGRDFIPIANSTEALTLAYESLTETEDPLYDRLLALIHGLTRPEVSAEDTSEDLILLIKQGASLRDLREVLSSQLVCLPTGEMISVLREMVSRIPRWSSLNMGQIQ